MGILDVIFDDKSKADSSDLSSVDENSVVNQTASDKPLYAKVFDSEESFNSASRADRMNAYQQLEIDSAKKQGRAPRQIVFVDLPPEYYGAYSRDTDKIYLQKDFLDNPDSRFVGMETVLHEGRHALQADYAANLVSDSETFGDLAEGIRASSLPGVYDKSVSDDLDFIDDPFGVPMGYALDPMELDARGFACTEMQELAEKSFPENEFMQKMAEANKQTFDKQTADLYRYGKQAYPDNANDLAEVSNAHAMKHAEALGFDYNNIKGGALATDAQWQTHSDYNKGVLPVPDEIKAQSESTDNDVNNENENADEQSDFKESGAEPENAEYSYKQGGYEEESGSEPEKESENTNVENNGMNAGAEPSAEESKQNNKEGSEEAGAEPENNENLKNVKDSAEESGSEPSSEVNKDKNEGAVQQAEKGAYEDNSHENANGRSAKENDYEAGCEPAEDNSNVKHVGGMVDSGSSIDAPDNSKESGIANGVGAAMDIADSGMEM